MTREWRNFRASDWSNWLQTGVELQKLFLDFRRSSCQDNPYAFIIHYNCFWSEGEEFWYHEELTIDIMQENNHFPTKADTIIESFVDPLRQHITSCARSDMWLPFRSSSHSSMSQDID